MTFNSQGRQPQVMCRDWGPQPAFCLLKVRTDRGISRPQLPPPVTLATFEVAKAPSEPISGTWEGERCFTGEWGALHVRGPCSWGRASACYNWEHSRNLTGFVSERKGPGVGVQSGAPGTGLVLDRIPNGTWFLPALSCHHLEPCPPLRGQKPAPNRFQEPGRVSFSCTGKTATDRVPGPGPPAGLLPAKSTNGPGFL